MTTLPCFVEDADPLLVRAPGADLHMHGTLWLLTQGETRKTKRVRLFTQFVSRSHAIGAAITGGKPVVAIEGDSAFGFSGMEIETICRYHLPVVIVVLSNGGIYRGDDVNRRRGGSGRRRPDDPLDGHDRRGSEGDGRGASYQARGCGGSSSENWSCERVK